MGSISEFIDRHYRHFNAAVLKDAANAYVAHLERGGKMMITLAGAMSTAELGVSLAEMIRRDKVHAITCTGANLEEDLFNLVARSQYVRLPNYRELTPQDEQDLLRRHLNRVTDTCIPEEEAIRRIEKVVIGEWVAAAKNEERGFPHEFLFRILKQCRLKKFYEIDPDDSWMVAAAHKALPMFVRLEDSTLGNIYAARCITERLQTSTLSAPGSNT
jgi:deoxyhypusine synthase